MLLTNTDSIAGKEIIETIGLVKGNTIRAKNLGHDIGATLKNLVGGELRSYTDMITDAREESIERMTKEAKSLGADAIINVRFTTSQLMAGAAEILAYGTAVKLK